MADIELGVRFIEELDTSGESWKKLDELKEYKEGGRIEVFQEGEWQKICMIKVKQPAQRFLSALRVYRLRYIVIYGIKLLKMNP